MHQKILYLSQFEDEMNVQELQYDHERSGRLELTPAVQYYFLRTLWKTKSIDTGLCF